MEIELLEKGHYNLKVLISGISHVYANTLRRICITEVPTLAVDTVMFTANNSAMYDEIISHRIGLIPLKTDLDLLVPRSRCSCEYGCVNCTVIYKLEKTGPATIYSKDLIPDHPGLGPVHENVPIAKLAENQELKMEAYAVLGIAKHHAKWQPAMCTYKNVPVVEISKDCDECKKCIDACPKKLFNVGGNKITVEDVNTCTMCRACVEACPKDAIKVDYLKDSFIFHVESFGSLAPETILTKAIGVLTEKSDSFLEELNKVKIK